MVEPPDSWDRVTAWLAVSRLSDRADLEAVWDSMVTAGWVRSEACEFDCFRQYVTEELADDITGPSASRRIMLRLCADGAVTDAGLELDAWGHDAERRKAKEERRE